MVLILLSIKMRIIHKFIFKSIILCIFIGGIVYYSKSKLNSIDENIKTAFTQNNYNIEYKSKKTKFSFINSKIVLLDIKITTLDENKLDSKNNLKIDELVCEFDLFSLIFESNVINKIKLHNPTINFYQNIKPNKDQAQHDSVISQVIENFKIISNTKINVQNGRIIYFNNRGILIKEINNINGIINKKNAFLLFNLKASENDFDFNIKSSIQNITFNSYLIDGYVSSDREEFNYKVDLKFDAHKSINQLNGAIDAKGNDFMRLAKIFCSSCKYESSYNPDEKFTLKGNIGYDSKIQSISLRDINFDKNNNKFNLSISYDMNHENFDIKIKGDDVKILSDNKNFNIFALKNQVMDNQYNSINQLISYFEILKNFNFTLNFLINKVEFFGQKIINFNGKILSKNKKIQIQQLTGKLDDKYDINSFGEIFSNDVRSKLKMKIEIPLNNKSDNIYFDIDAMLGNLTINNIKIQNDGLSVLGKILLRKNDESSDIEGIVNIDGYNLYNVYDKYKILIENKGNDKNGVLGNILAILNKMKINTNFHLIFTNSLLNQNLIENIKFSIIVDEKRVLIENSLKDKKFININNKIQIFWDNLKPKVNIDTTGNFLDLKVLAKLFKIHNYKNYFVINEEDFKKNNDKVIWRNFSISLKDIVNINLKINANINNIIHDVMQMDNLNINMNSKDNILKVNNISLQIKNGKINIAGNVDINNQVIVGIIMATNINFNDLKRNKNKPPVYFSASGKFATNGDNFQKIISNFSTKIRYLIYNFSIKNMDLNLFVNNIHKITDYSSLVSLSERSVVSGETLFNEIKGDFDIANGLLKNNCQFSSNRFTGAGIINLLTTNLVFKGISRIAFIPYQYKGTVYSDIEWSGNLFNVNKAFNSENLRKIASR